ncbi:phosphonate ABC transporter, permease protein PhnE [Haloferax mediterranei ATCC 33500]|uniref:Phosphonate ABC transporter permease n=1 Tax=Haloferax mediterranei (strain ATCC 33500 / DSM 1411 / JCM 8866 / NBRC 14739 / NCIMB 2177 / R-4) TaxID=523841 RepID=I3R6I5_HALMT|nr:phosphonate ABC transporter, permease protein PhnE [Haloferax mediterranei]AFK19845.1 phosphonates ABC transporter permease protein [Haloferax mediterranei ATCC 33500]AHZ23229.1 phosphonate ABC transporter permease [Haloferax mediterranei ATCC 33500]ELZ99813.1 phosphonates ABC transporter permease protein [Haloferax mediterranei ATCC 33500]MDX5987405.1 phosphonate ABC transporter, permease protein PhnE [Haloferax mediterranei ATCC 33500]QCQ73909.1 phosphonate ABC transporter, permease prote
MATKSGSVDGKWERPTAFYNRTTKYLVYAVIAAFVLYSIWSIRVPPDRLLRGVGEGIALVSNMLPPALTPVQFDLMVQGIFESILMSIVATTLGIIVSAPVAFMAANNLAPRPIYLVGRSIIAVTRSFHELIVAIVMVKAVGFGPLAGVLALAFKTVGFFAKLLSEEIEDIDTGQMQAIEAVGGSRLQVYLYSVLPQIIPRIIGLSIYRLDINLRHSTVVGIVGAGGIGITLLNSFQKYDYQYSSMIILVIVGIVMIGEAASAYARRRVQ